MQHEPTSANDFAHARGTMRVIFYAVAFITGAIVMGFEMLGSRYLNPYFGSGIYTWASLISTILAALAAGYFLGGWAADRYPSPVVLGASVVIGSLYLTVLPLFAETILEGVLASTEDVRMGSLVSAAAITFLPVTFLGMYSPYAIRLLLHSAHRSGTVSGTVYGVSTVGSIIGTLGTTFILMPSIGSRAITVALGVAGIICGGVLMLLPRLQSLGRASAVLLAAWLGLSVALFPPSSHADDLIDGAAVAEVLRKPDGLIAHVESEYNDIFVTKQQQFLTMSFQRYRSKYLESTSNLSDPDELPVPYTQLMTLGLVYPDENKRMLMIGLGGGSTTTYLARYLRGMAVDSVELDPGVIAVAKKYFGLRATERVRFIENDGRVFLARNKAPYDLIMLDAFRGGYVPFHLLTREFYALVKDRLTPTGVAVFNIHKGTKLYASTLTTLRAVYPSVDLYSSGSGNVIAVVGAHKRQDDRALMRKATGLQSTYDFRHSLVRLLTARIEEPDAQKAPLLTDDFAPVNLYDAITEQNKRRW